MFLLLVELEKEEPLHHEVKPFFVKFIIREHGILHELPEVSSSVYY